MWFGNQMEETRQWVPGARGNAWELYSPGTHWSSYDLGPPHGRWQYNETGPPNMRWNDPEVWENEPRNQWSKPWRPLQVQRNVYEPPSPGTSWFHHDTSSPFGWGYYNELEHPSMRWNGHDSWGQDGRHQWDEPPGRDDSRLKQVELKAIKVVKESKMQWPENTMSNATTVNTKKEDGKNFFVNNDEFRTYQFKGDFRSSKRYDARAEDSRPRTINHEQSAMEPLSPSEHWINHDPGPPIPRWHFHDPFIPNARWNVQEPWVGGVRMSGYGDREGMALRPTMKARFRWNRYKVVVDVEEGRRRSKGDRVVIRKNHREESMQKKRREDVNAQQLAAFAAEKLEALTAVVEGVWTDDPNLQLSATTHICAMLSLEENPPIDEVIQAGIVPLCVEFLRHEQHPQLQLEAAWALTNIALGIIKHTMAVIDNEALPIFVQHVTTSNDKDVREQAVWALGNIVGDSPEFRDVVLNSGALHPLLAQLNEHSKLSMIRIAIWTLSNFCRGKPQPHFDHVKVAFPVLAQLIRLDDEKVITDACWALSYLSDDVNEKIEDAIEAAVCPRIVHLLRHSSVTVLIPALRTVRHIIFGDGLQACLRSLMTMNIKICIKKETCWVISSITDGTIEQIRAVFVGDIINPLLYLLQTAEFDIRGEAAWAILNATCDGIFVIKYLVEQGCIKALCDLLSCPDPKLVKVCLEGFDKVLKAGEVEKNMGHSCVNRYADLVQDADGLDEFDDLQQLENEEIYTKVVEILDTYWQTEEVEHELGVHGSSQPDQSNVGENYFSPSFRKEAAYLAGGSLHAYLHQHEPASLPLDKLIALSLDTAPGMENILSNRIIHQYFNPENLLFDKIFHIDIADFGTACEVFSCALLADDLGTHRWMTPEIIKRKRDVYSFVFMLWEIVVGPVVYEEMSQIEAAGPVVDEEEVDINVQKHEAIYVKRRPNQWMVAPISEVASFVNDEYHQLHAVHFHRDYKNKKYQINFKLCFLPEWMPNDPPS